jgi:hypothetical protein
VWCMNCKPSFELDYQRNTIPIFNHFISMHLIRDRLNADPPRIHDAFEHGLGSFALDNLKPFHEVYMKPMNTV